MKELYDITDMGSPYCATKSAASSHGDVAEKKIGNEKYMKAPIITIAHNKEQTRRK